jgi:hypothetical protein
MQAIYMGNYYTRTAMQFIARISKMGDRYYLSIPTELKSVASKLHRDNKQLKVLVREVWTDDELEP